MVERNGQAGGPILPIGGPGFGSFEQYGVGQFVIDTGREGFPDKRLDVMLIPVGEIQPVSAIQIPRGAGVVVIHPEQMAQMRAIFKAAEAKRAPAPPNPAQKG